MPKALSHGADVAALFVVVRTVVEVLARNGRPLREPVRAGFDLLERWDGGEGVETSALLRAQGLVHENEVPLAEREPDRALSWANTAIGNLLWMAQKTRGWKGAHPGIMDACAHALSSLGVPGLPDAAALEELRAHAADALAKRA